MAYEPIIDRVIQIEPDGTVIRYIKAEIDSSDIKPTLGIAVGSNIFERDTGKQYYFTNKGKWVVPDDVGDLKVRLSALENQVNEVAYNDTNETQTSSFKGVTVTRKGNILELDGSDTSISYSDISVYLCGDLLIDEVAPSQSLIANHAVSLSKNRKYMLRLNLLSGTVTVQEGRSQPFIICCASTGSLTGNGKIVFNGAELYRSWYNNAGTGITAIVFKYPTGTTFNNAVYSITMIDLDAEWTYSHAVLSNSIAKAEDPISRESHSEGELLMVSGELVRVKPGGIAQGELINTTSSGNVVVTTVFEEVDRRIAAFYQHTS